MKKIILLLVISFNLSAQKGLWIDSIVPNNSCYNQVVKVYMRQTGTWGNPSEVVYLQNGGANLKQCTIQSLQDSGLVWNLKIIQGYYVVGSNNLNSYSNYYSLSISNCYYGVEQFESMPENREYDYFEYGVYKIKIDRATKQKYLISN